MGFLSSKMEAKFSSKFHNEQCESIFHVGDNNHKYETVKDGFFFFFLEVGALRQGFSV